MNIVSMVIAFITDIASIVISVAALVITLRYNRRQISILQKQLEEMTKKPELEAQFDYSIIDMSEELVDHCVMPVPGTFTVAKMVRVKVSNKGEATAKNCIAKAKVFRNNNKWYTSDEVTLHWIKYREELYKNKNDLCESVDIKELYKPVDIDVNGHEIADLVYIVKEVVKEGSKNYVAIRCYSCDSEYGFQSRVRDDSIQLKKDDTIKVTVYCNNVTSKSVCLRVKKDPTYDEINSSNVQDFFEEVECPKL